MFLFEFLLITTKICDLNNVCKNIKWKLLGFRFFSSIAFSMIWTLISLVCFLLKMKEWVKHRSWSIIERTKIENYLLPVVLKLPIEGIDRYCKIWQLLRQSKRWREERLQKNPPQWSTKLLSPGMRHKFESTCSNWPEWIKKYTGRRWKRVNLINISGNMFITMCKFLLISLRFADVKVGRWNKQGDEKKSA